MGGNVGAKRRAKVPAKRKRGRPKKLTPEQQLAKMLEQRDAAALSGDAAQMVMLHRQIQSVRYADAGRANAEHKGGGG